jgi:hypothetical protein
MARPLSVAERVMMLAALAFVVSAPQLEGATVRGQIQYSDRGGLVAIRSANVEIWYKGTGWFDTWNAINTVTTDQFGNFTHSDALDRGTYSVRVYAVNPAAWVRPLDNGLGVFWVNVGFPGTLYLSPSSASSTLDFSQLFTDPSVARYFSVAETLRIGRDYANARRDPGQTDVIPQVNVLPTSWSLTPTTYYNQTLNTIVIQDSLMANDWVVLHEYGHHLEASISSLPVGPPNYHDGCQASFFWSGGLLVNSPELAWLEGFASYFAAAVGRMRSPDRAIPDGLQFAAGMETPANCGVIGQQSTSGTVTAAMVENLVQASLWDLVDPVGHPSQGVEAHDSIAFEDATIMQIFDRELDGSLPANILGFRSAWIARGKNAAALDCILSNHGILSPTMGCRGSTAVKLTGDFNSDGKADIALTGAQGWGSIPVAFSNGDGSFFVTNQNITDFPVWATNPRAAKVTGDFNGDGRTDIALVGGIGWSSVPVALSNGAGGFTIVNNTLATFASQASDPEARKITGDFNSDGLTDIALVGGLGWTSVPVAFSNGLGGFSVTNQPISLSMADRVSHPLATLRAGRFSPDYHTDIAVLGLPSATTTPILTSQGNGEFYSITIPSLDFATWARDTRSDKLVGDFNGDGFTDIALSGVPGWTSVPVAMSTPAAATAGAGAYAIQNAPIGDFGAWSASPRVKRLVGDFDGFGYADIALTGVAGWASVPVASSIAPGFVVNNTPVGDFASWSATSGVAQLVGDFNGDGKADIALTGASGWGSVPVAFSNGFAYLRLNGPPGPLSFTVANVGITDFATWASMK